MALPAAGFHDTTRDVSATTGALNDTLAAQRQLLGAVLEVETTIASGAIAPVSALITVDTESDGAADDLDNITVGSFDGGFLLLLRMENAARIVTLKHESGGAGQISMAGGADLVLDSVTKSVLLRFDSGASPTTWGEVDRMGFSSVAYSGLSLESSATATTIPGSSEDWTQKAQVVSFDTNMTSFDAIADHTNDHITVGSTGTYHLAFSGSFSGTNGNVISGAFFKNNGATQLSPRFTRTLNAAGAVGSASTAVNVDLTAADTVEFWIQNESATADVTFQDAAITLEAIGR